MPTLPLVLTYSAGLTPVTVLLTVNVPETCRAEVGAIRRCRRSRRRR